MEKLNAMVLVGGAADKSFREYRRGNWTVNETMVLIEAKKQDYGRRMKRFKESDQAAAMAGSAAGDSISTRSQETRWKWVEEYCWRYGCYRSQNQCNDRWDNLMRDYKKVRTYELGAQGRQHDHVSYWSLERHERKRRCLPCNMLPEIYQALTEVAQMRGPAAGLGMEEEQGRRLSCSMPLIPHSSPVSKPNASEPPPSAPPPHTHTQPLATTAALDSEGSEHSDSHERKRKREENSNSSSRSSVHDLSSALSKCASILTEALQESQQREDTRHKDLIKIEERKAMIEESKSETSAQSMQSLATSINKLASSILGLATDKGSTGASK